MKHFDWVLNSRPLRYLILGAFALWILSPYFTTGYYLDDSQNSTLASYLSLRNLTIHQFIHDQILGWMFGNGRLYPLGLTWDYLQWYLVRDLGSYRLLQMGLVLSNIMLFVALVRSLGATRGLALLSGLTVLCLFQLRGYHDPISSYSCLMQVGFALGSASLLLFSEFWKNNSALALYSSLGLYASALLLYEPELAFFPVLFFMTRQHAPSGKSLPARWGHLSLTLLYLAAVCYLRITHPPY